ncbi:MAG: M48 family metallopeptidase [Clostridia bacterium]|nr:M48 family metallopeptidase [Clostridia bacterium]
MKTKTLSLDLNGETVSVELTAKKVKNINIRIRPNGCVCVSYPLWISEREALSAVINRADFILSSVKKASNSIAAKLNAEEEKQLSGKCRMELTEAVLKFFPLFDNAFPFPEIHFKKMTSRWGSCVPAKNLITFNTALASVPKECAEYVVVHELCHFIHPNHSKSFYAEVEKHIPDWKERKKKLNSYHI